MDSRVLALTLFLVGFAVAPPPGPSPNQLGKPQGDKQPPSPGADDDSYYSEEYTPFDEDGQSNQEQEQQNPLFGFSNQGQKLGFQNQQMYPSQGYYQGSFKAQDGPNQMPGGYQTPDPLQQQQLYLQQMQAFQQLQQQQQQQQQQQAACGYMPQAGLGYLPSVYNNVPMMIAPHDFTPFSSGYGVPQPQMYNPSLQQGPPGYGAGPQGQVQSQAQIKLPKVQGQYFNPSQAGVQKLAAQPQNNGKPYSQQ